MNLDIQSNRRARKYSTTEMRQRIAWSVVRIVFHISPRPAFGFRRWLLRCFGATIGEGVNIYPTVRIFLPSLLTIGNWSSIGEHAEIYNLGKITIGDNTTISQRAHICAGTHDHLSATFDLQRTPVSIGHRCWICADAFIGPAVQITDDVIVAARSVVVADINTAVIVAGNPAKKIKDRPPIRPPESDQP